jgi:putative ABC transport system permease protein
MRKVLMNYAYRTNLSWWIFLITILIVTIMGMVAVTHQALKAARKNPVDSLRYE